MSHGNTGKRNALKPPERRADSHLHLRVNSSDKTRWEYCARAEGVPLSVWVVHYLNKASFTG
jgi:predicted HicB family RNase H-like nuclease